MNASVTSIALADDHAIVRMGFRRLLELEPDLHVVAEFSDADSACSALTGAAPLALDVLILDLSMPGTSGLALLRQLHLRRPELKVLIVTMHDSAAMQAQCLRAGAAGFLPKSSDPEALVQAVRRVQAGLPATCPSTAASFAQTSAQTPASHASLTLREQEVLQHLLAGRGVDAIAPRLGVSEKTVSNVQTLIRQKLGVSNAVELLHYAQLHGLMPQ